MYHNENLYVKQKMKKEKKIKVLSHNSFAWGIKDFFYRQMIWIKNVNEDRRSQENVFHSRLRNVILSC